VRKAERRVPQRSIRGTPSRGARTCPTSAVSEMRSSTARTDCAPPLSRTRPSVQRRVACAPLAFELGEERSLEAEELLLEVERTCLFEQVVRADLV
jgi:hypothetical protein